MFKMGVGKFKLGAGIAAICLLISPAAFAQKHGGGAAPHAAIGGARGGGVGHAFGGARAPSFHAGGMRSFGGHAPSFGGAHVRSFSTGARSFSRPSMAARPSFHPNRSFHAGRTMM